MGKLIFLAILAAGGYWVLQQGLPAVAGSSPSEAYKVYTRFADYLAHNQYGNARSLASRGAVRAVQVQELRGRRNTKLGISGRAVRSDDLALAANGEIRGISYESISESTSQDGSEVTIEALQRICRDRSGCDTVQHDVEVCRSGDVWKVCRFRES